tara:strand:+ start:4499 stop:4696 length:198 start_codon:yes stop_codon:yes gene_type:complete
MSASQENIVNNLQTKIRDRMNEHADHMSTGNCKDFEEYRYFTGIIAGLALVERDILDLLEIVNRQ